MRQTPHIDTTAILLRSAHLDDARGELYLGTAVAGFKCNQGNITIVVTTCRCTADLLDINPPPYWNVVQFRTTLPDMTRVASFASTPPESSSE